MIGSLTRDGAVGPEATYGANGTAQVETVKRASGPPRGKGVHSRDGATEPGRPEEPPLRRPPDVVEITADEQTALVRLELPQQTPPLDRSLDTEQTEVDVQRRQLRRRPVPGL